MKSGHGKKSYFRRGGLSGLVDYLSVRVVSRRLSVVVPVLCMGLILMVASIPADHGEEVQRRFLRFLLLPSLLQNLAHIPAYALLAFLWRWSLDVYTRARTAVILALVLTIGFGIFQEFYQSLIPGRYASLSDVLSDALGAALGLWVFS
jgi:VanZ family protein